MKLTDLRQALFKDFCDEHDFWYGIPGDSKVIEEGCCTLQEYNRFKTLQCIGYCDFGTYESFADMKKAAISLRPQEQDLTFEDLDRLIKSKTLFAIGEKQDALLWAVKKMQKKQRELFGKQTDVEAHLRKLGRLSD